MAYQEDVDINEPITFVICDYFALFCDWASDLEDDILGPGYAVFCNDKERPTRGRQKIDGDRIFVLEPCRASLVDEALAAIIPCGFSTSEVNWVRYPPEKVTVIH